MSQDPKQKLEDLSDILRRLVDSGVWKTTDIEGFQVVAVPGMPDDKMVILPPKGPALLVKNIGRE